MNSREKILAAISKNQPPTRSLPAIANIQALRFNDKEVQFITVLESIGGKVQHVNSYDEIVTYIYEHFTDSDQYITTIPSLTGIKQLSLNVQAHTLENIEVAIIPGIFGVAENGAIWVTQKQMGIRALPFICQRLVIVLKQGELVDNMHLAYERIGAETYDFGAFIAGPSKTADIEQSLVLGAHGARNLVVFIMKESEDNN